MKALVTSVLKTRLATALLFLLALLLGAPLAAAAAPPSHPAARGIGSAPAGLVAAIARTQAKAAAHNPAYAIAHNGCAQIKARNAAPALAGCFGQQSSAFSTGQHTISLHLTAWGRAGHLRPLTLTRSVPRANRIEYRGQHIVEWWRVLPLGYEQGFTLKQAPEGSGQVVLQLSASAAPKIVHGTLAWGKLRYGKLHVTDSAGHILPATLSARGKTITLTFDAPHARYPVTIDPLVWVQQQEVTASNGAAGDQFGYSVALSGNGTTALVGAWYKTVGSNTQQGAAYVYTLANGTWSQVAELTASNGAAGDLFGISVALSSTGTTALVGAGGVNVAQGAAYVYRLSNGTWSQVAELSASNGAANDVFGNSVALSSTGTTALVGAKGVNGAYIYTLANGTWSQVAELTASNGATSDQFGYSVALSSTGTTALVGAKGVNSYQGAAYIYTLSNGTWSQVAELTASNGGAAGDGFGYSVALSSTGTTALVGAYGVNSYQGAAYIYTTTNNWATNTQAAKLTASNGAANDSFGWSVALSGDGTTALVGGIGVNSNQGAAYIYTKPSNGWASTSADTATLNGAASVYFGISVAFSATGTTALVGASNSTVAGNASQGAAYFFTGSNLSAVLSAPAAVGVGAQFSSQYILTNASVTASAALTVMLPLPATHASYVSVTPTQGSCTYDTTTQVATCPLGSIASNGGTASVTLKLNATGAGGTTIAQSGKLLNGSPDLAQTANTAIVSPPTVSGLSAVVTVTAPSTGSEAFTLTGTGALTVTAASANTALLPAADIVGAAACTAVGSCVLTLTPITGQVGNAVVTVTVADAFNQSGTGTFTFTANKPAPPTVSGLKALSVAYGKSGSETFKLVGGGPLTLTATSSNTKLLPAAHITGVSSCIAAGSCVLTLTPVSGQAGSATVTVTVADTYGQSSKGTFTFTANKPAAPAASGLSALPVAYGKSGTEAFTLSGTGALTLTATSANTALLPNANIITGAGKCAAAGSCVLTLMPATGQAGSATVTVTVADTYGQSSKGTFTFTVNKPAAPAASGLSAVTVTAPSAGSEAFKLTGTGALTLTATSSNTTLLPNAHITGVSSCTAAGACTLTLTPVSGQAGSATVTVAVADAYSQSGTGTFTFTVIPPPAANNLSLTTYENSAISTNLSAGAPNGDALSYAIAAQPTNGALTVNTTTGAFTYTPTNGYSGSDSFTFTAKDTVTSLVSNTATVTLTINATPPSGQVPPVASNLTLTTYTGQALAGTLPAVVSPSSDALSCALVTQPAHGTVKLNATSGKFIYTPTSGYSGADAFTFKAKDTVTGLASNTATVTITINASPPPGQVPPVASNLTLTTYTGQALAGTLPAAVSPSSDALSYALVTQPAHGTVKLNAASGKFTYTPTNGYSDRFTFKAKDTVTGLVSNTATISITIKRSPHPPASGSGGGAFGLWSLLGFLGLALLIGLSRRNARD